MIAQGLTKILSIQQH